MRTVEGSGPESSARGFPLHGNGHWDGPACAGGPSAFIFVPLVSAHHLIRCHWRKNWVHLADSGHVVKRRLYIKPLLCMHDRYVESTCMKSQHTIPPLTHTGSVEVGPPVIDVYERCLLGVFQATVCARIVERVCSRAVDLSYLSIPGPWWRGSRAGPA